MPPPPPPPPREGGLDARTSEDEGHRRKRHQVNPVALQQVRPRLALRRASGHAVDTS